MDTDLSKALEQLQAKKKSINLDVDLTRECKSIIDLNERLALLLNEIQTLRKGVQEQSLFVSDNCDLLRPSHKNLERTSQVFEFSAQLTKLNRLCKRIDQIQAFKHHHQHLGSSNNKSSLVKDNVDLTQDGTNADEGVDDCDDEMTNRILDISRQFEVVYKPLEGLLSERLDLPYVSYANKAKNFITALQAPNVRAQNIKQ